MSRRSTPLHSAAESNDVAAVRAELAKGVSTEIRNAGFEETPLHKAAVKGNVAVAEELLRAGADIAAVRSGGFTPLHMSETVEIAKLLLDHGADKSAKASNMKTPSEQAAGGTPVQEFIAGYTPQRIIRPQMQRTQQALVRPADGATASAAGSATLPPAIHRIEPEPEPERESRASVGNGSSSVGRYGAAVGRGGGGGGYSYGRGRGGSDRGGGHSGDSSSEHKAALAALAEEDEETRNTMEAVALLSQARALQKRNQAAGIGDSQGIDDKVQELYERIMDIGGLAFGGSIPAAVLQKKGASEEELLKVPTITLTPQTITDYCATTGQDTCECILCLDELKPGDKVAKLSCGHLFHHSPPVPDRSELPDTLVIRGHATVITQFKSLRYRAGAWECGVCERPQPTHKNLWLYHEGPIGTADDTGYDCCIRCTMRGGWVTAKVPDGAAVCEAGGVEAWLDKTGSCPTCREEYKPAEPEPQLQGVRPNEEHVKALGAIGFDEATARQCLSVAFNDLELAAQYCMEGIPAARLRRA